MTEIVATIRKQVRWPILWGLILIVHLAAGGAWWWLAPKGFPLGHDRFWVNSVLPLLVAFVLAAGIHNLIKSSRFIGPLLILVPGFWAGVGIAAVVLFPSSTAELLLFCVPAVLIFLVFAWVSLAMTPKEFFALLVGMSFGMGAAFSQQAPAPSTQPSQSAFKTAPEKLDATDIFEKEGVTFDPATGWISIAVSNNTTFTLNPLLTFHSRSPDRCWTYLANSRDRQGPHRRLLGTQTRGPEWTAFYQSDFSSYLSLNTADSKLITLESASHLPSPIYSHLNTYCDISIATPQPISIVFSPCPDTPIQVRPGRTAFLAKDGFHVVEAATAEKGPFTTLASGALARGEPLSLTFIAAGKPLCRLEIKDWSSQASLELSPTAGWEVPMNSIALWPSGSGCLIRITLAGTSVGRGSDSVGHKAGTYRGRMLVELLN